MLSNMSQGSNKNIPVPTAQIAQKDKEKVASLIKDGHKKTKKERDKPFTEVSGDAPVNPEGRMIIHPDASKQEPRDFLLIARVVKRNCRPLTVAEV